MYVKCKVKEMELLCTKSKYGNFVEGKTYKAVAFATMGKGVNVEYTHFKITDEDGDYYSIKEEHFWDMGPLLFKEVTKTNVIESFELGSTKAVLLKIETEDGGTFSAKETKDTFWGVLTRQTSYVSEAMARRVYEDMCKEMRLEYQKEKEPEEREF